MNRKYPLIVAVLTVLLVIVSVALITKNLEVKRSIIPQPLPTNTNTNQPTNQNTEPVPISYGHDVSNKKTIEFLSVAETYNAQQISDRFGINVSALKETEPRNPAKTYSGEYSLSFTKLGTVNGAELYSISQNCAYAENDNEDDWSTPLTYIPSGCVTINVLATFDLTEKKFKIFTKHSYGIGNSYREIPDIIPEPLSKITTKTDKSISDLEAPQTVTLPYGYSLSPYSPTLTLSAIPTAKNTASKEEYKILGTSLEGYNIYTSLNSSGGYLLKIGDFGYADYKIKFPFYNNQRVPQITWNNGNKNETDYSPYSWRSGSGPFDGGGELNMLQPDEAKDFYNRFIVIGKAINGEFVYAPGAADDSLIERYAYNRQSNDDKYDNAQPDIFLIKNPLNQFIIWTKTELLPMAERGKPVVYLYPTTTKQVEVKLGKEIEVLKSEPEYVNGWKVTAQPDGTLTTVNGNKYPYLYWDGNGPAYKVPERGYVVASKDINQFLVPKLEQLGLNAKESSDFREFWVPIVSKSPYALISFVPQDEWSKATPLSISPAPDTTIRVFMDWKPISAPLSILPQILPPTPVRTGFTAVEWGGLLYKN